jgi:hypothetical protein
MSFSRFIRQTHPIQFKIEDKKYYRIKVGDYIRIYERTGTWQRFLEVQKISDVSHLSQRRVYYFGAISRELHGPVFTHGDIYADNQDFFVEKLS